MPDPVLPCDCICHLDGAPPHPDGRRCPHCGQIEATHPADTMLAEIVLTVRYPIHPAWDEKRAQHVRDNVIGAVENTVRCYYGTERWAADASVEVVE